MTKSQQPQESTKCPRCHGTGKNGPDSLLGYEGKPCYYCSGTGIRPDMSAFKPSQESSLEEARELDQWVIRMSTYCNDYATGKKDGLIAWAKLVDDLEEIIARESAKARRETARTILHKGWCIPEMEVQVEDYTAQLDAEIAAVRGGEDGK